MITNFFLIVQYKLADDALINRVKSVLIRSSMLPVYLSLDLAWLQHKRVVGVELHVWAEQ